MFRRAKVILSFGVTFFFLYLAVRDIHPAELIVSLSGTPVWLVLFASLLAIIAMVLRAWRWQFLLRPLGMFPMSTVYPVIMMGFMANNVLPAHAGEVVRAWLLARREKVDAVAAFGTVVLERLADGLALLSMLLVVALTVPLPDWLRDASFFAALGGIGSLFSLLALTPERSWLRGRLFFLIDRLPPAFAARVRAKTLALLSGFASIRSLRDLTTLYLMSLLVWLQLAATVWVILLAYPLQSPLEEFLLPSLTCVVSLAFAAALPSSPGYFGVTQIAFVLALEPFAVPASAAVAISLVYHLTQYIPVTAAGIYYLLREGITFASLSRAAQPVPKSS